MLQAARVFAGMLLFIAAPAHAEDWYRATETEELIGFIDSDSMQAEGDRVSFDLFTGFIDGQGKSGEVYYVIERVQVDCSGNTWATISVRSYDIDRKLVAAKASGKIADPMLQAEFAENIRKLACALERESSAKSSDPFKDSDDYFGTL